MCTFTFLRRVVADLLTAREVQISQLVSSHAAYDDLLVKAAKGLEFYARLESNVSKLAYRVREVVTRRQEERDAKIAKR